MLLQTPLKLTCTAGVEVARRCLSILVHPLLVVVTGLLLLVPSCSSIATPSAVGNFAEAASSSIGKLMAVASNPAATAEDMRGAIVAFGDELGSSVDKLEKANADAEEQPLGGLMPWVQTLLLVLLGGSHVATQKRVGQLVTGAGNGTAAPGAAPGAA